MKDAHILLFRHKSAILWLVTLLFCVSPVYTASLDLKEVDSFPLTKIQLKKSGQLPQSRIAKGKKDILHAWFSEATDRYAHGVLGDSLEAAQLNVETPEGQILHVILPSDRVFEDLEPRLEDLDSDGRDEVLVIEAHQRLGASLARP